MISGQQADIPDERSEETVPTSLAASLILYLPPRIYTCRVYIRHTFVENARIITEPLNLSRNDASSRSSKMANVWGIKKFKKREKRNLYSVKDLEDTIKKKRNGYLF